MATNDETQFEKDVREGKLVNPEKILQYHIDKFNQGGGEKPVKVMPTEANDRDHITGFFTQEKFIIGRTAKQMEHDLGLKSGDLENGATIYELAEIPNAEQFVPAGYTHMPDGRFYEDGQEYPVGSGAIQFKLKEYIPTKVVGKVNYDQPWLGHSAGEETKIISQPEPQETASKSEIEIAQTVGETVGNLAAGPAGEAAGKVADEAASKAQSKALESAGQSTENPTEEVKQASNARAGSEISEQDEEQDYGYGLSY